MGQSQPLFVYFHPFFFTISIIQIKKRRWFAWGRRMVGGDKTTELWRPPPKLASFMYYQFFTWKGPASVSMAYSWEVLLGVIVSFLPAKIIFWNFNRKLFHQRGSTPGEQWSGRFYHFSSELWGTPTILQLRVRIPSTNIHASFIFNLM